MLKNFLSLVCILSFSIQVFGLSIIRGPYLQIATSHGITIRWRTDSLSTSIVHYGLNNASLNNTYTNISLKTEHSITLNNLTYNTLYYYDIGGNNIVLQPSSSSLYFKTSPIASANYNQPIRFWAMGDFSKQTIEQVQVRDAFLAKKGNHYIDGWLMLGDNAYESGLDVEYQNGVFNYYQTQILKNTPVYPVPGNHDYANDFNRRMDHNIPYLDIFSLPENAEMGGIPSGNERYYSFNYGNVHIINLDSYGLELVGGSYYGLSDTAVSPQVNWLTSDLDSNTLPWTIVNFHHPPFCMGTHNSDTELDLVDLRTNLVPILERYNVDLVLSGHSHTYERSQFMKNHYGFENTFDSNSHIRQFTNGFYDGSPNSCAYIKNSTTAAKDSGTIYMVVGSGSGIPYTPATSWPHGAMVFSNYAQNGSLLLTIEGNSLTAEWITNDTAEVVKDRFTIFKNVGTKHVLNANFGELVQLRASWPANKYWWSTGDSARIISFTNNQSMNYYVSDSLGCITDTFEIMLPMAVDEFVTKDIAIYPNPASDYISFTLTNQKVVNYSITDIMGRKIPHGLLENAAQGLISLPSNITNGYYILSLSVENKGIYRSKFLVCKPK